jgi:hypothetical protein
MGALGQERSRTALSLIRYERDLLEFMDRELGVERSLLIGFATTLDCLRRLFQDATIDTPHHLKAGRLVVVGLINYAHHCLSVDCRPSGTGTALYGRSAPER